MEHCNMAMATFFIFLQHVRKGTELSVYQLQIFINRSLYQNGVPFTWTADVWSNNLKVENKAIMLCGTFLKITFTLH